ncbi:hypothetical protein HLK59_33860 [Streptomyces sp. S3(2020)]|uniref:hypothetical protein n=1 Tax=Streptomyces sp. S3(2020) TaxID=2732044 RepID=UPI001487FAF2|nr:hypothetical protein [Streptomyces sp. S3(2020)]NNN35266.1 hypothetical protein [Streptomyces sp. S3(2020)]
MRTAFGLLVVIVGMVWLLGDEAALRAGGRWALSALPYALAATGLLLILRAAVPKGLLFGPVVLVAGGGLWAAYDAGVFEGRTADRIWPSVVIAIGVALSLGVRTEARGREEDHPLRRYRSVLVPVDRRVLTASAPLETLTVSSYFGNAVIDLSGARFAAVDSADDRLRVVRVDVTVFFGRVELVVGPSCAVVKGNVESTRAVRFAERVTVHATLEEYLRVDREDPRRPHRMVLNVLGLGGVVAIRSL